ASGQRAKDLGLVPMARIVAAASAGVDPREMGIGPVPATRKALDRAKLQVRDLDLVELNEAFAAQSLAVIRELGIDSDRVNVDGGAIAIGHPLGMSGARILIHLVHALRARGGRYGLATLCVGVGQGVSVIVESLDRAG
ncbi:MAG: 3-oxoadipyl-CoA thiolase, partial [Myxococcales bacterium]